MKVLITGAKGMLGTDLCALLSRSCDVRGVDIDGLDITVLKDALACVKDCKPDIIINCAAAANVDGCESEPDKAYLVNSIGARNLAAAANEAGAVIVHYSTDYVFDGNLGVPYTEYDRVNPESVYGKSKLAGEEYVRSLSNKHVIIRTQWLYGKNGPNFVKTILRTAKEKGKLSVVNDQTGCPTYTKDLALATEVLINAGDLGTFHITNSGTVSWYEFTAEILRQSNLSHVPLSPCTTAEFPRPAKRPAYSPLNNYCYKLLGYPPLRHFGDALRDYLQEI